METGQWLLAPPPPVRSHVSREKGHTGSKGWALALSCPGRHAAIVLMEILVAAWHVQSFDLLPAQSWRSSNKENQLVFLTPLVCAGENW